MDAWGIGPPVRVVGCPFGRLDHAQVSTKATSDVKLTAKRLLNTSSQVGHICPV